MNSDHFPISFKLNLQNPTPKVIQEYEKKLNFSKANWELFHEILSNKNAVYTGHYLDSLDVNALNLLITKDIKAAAYQSIPILRCRSGNTFPKVILNLILKRK